MMKNRADLKRKKNRFEELVSCIKLEEENLWIVMMGTIANETW